MLKSPESMTSPSLTIHFTENERHNGVGAAVGSEIVGNEVGV